MGKIRAYPQLFNPRCYAFDRQLQFYPTTPYDLTQTPESATPQIHSSQPEDCNMGGLNSENKGLGYMIV